MCHNLMVSCIRFGFVQAFSYIKEYSRFELMMNIPQEAGIDRREVDAHDEVVLVARSPPDTTLSLPNALGGAKVGGRGGPTKCRG